MQNPAPRTFANKLSEGVTAIALTLRYGREAVLAHYLRIVPYGNNSHGIAHAARMYFDKPVEDLSWAEIALLAAIPQSPTLLNPMQSYGLARAVKRGHRALDELLRQGVVGAGRGRPCAPAACRDARTARAAPSRCAACRAALPVACARRAAALFRDGPAPHRDARSAHAGVTSARSRARSLRAWRGQGAEQVAALVVERATGKVLAAIGSSDYRDNRAGAVDFLRTERSPGSTLKPFIYALALERGVIRPSDPLADLPEGASWINNADGQFLGPMLPRQALANSRNVPATNLLRRTGLDAQFRLPAHARPARRLRARRKSSACRWRSARCRRLWKSSCAPMAFSPTTDALPISPGSRGSARATPTRVLSTDTARLVTSFLADPLARLPSFPRYGPTEYPFPVALKTGTSQGYRDAWTVAWSNDYLVGVWLGRADAGTMTTTVRREFGGAARPCDPDAKSTRPSPAISRMRLSRRRLAACRWNSAPSAAAATAIAGRR